MIGAEMQKLLEVKVKFSPKLITRAIPIVMLTRMMSMHYTKNNALP